MTPNNTIDVDSLHRFIHALAPPISELLTLSDRLRRDQHGFDSAHATRLHDTAELLQALQTEFRAWISLEAQAPEPQAVAVQAMCQDLTEVLCEHARHHQIQVEVKAPPDLRAWTDPVLCRHILRRLMANALRYNRTGGRIVLSARATGSGGVLLRVADSGIGIDRCQRRALFAPFERLGKELCPTDGTGMGLAMAQRMATHLGTRVSMRSRLGRGSIFRLLLPRA